ncbi:MAG: glycosyltransferase [Verrucomicrobiota bacterium]
MHKHGGTILYLDTGPWLGGAQRSMLTLINALDWQTWNPMVVAADDSEFGVLYECEFHRISCEHVRFRHWLRRPSGALAFLWDGLRLRRAFRHLRRDRRIDLVHANTARAGLLACMGVPQTIPMVVHDRDVSMPGVARRILARRAARVIALSETVAKTWARTPNARVEIVPNGFDIESLREVSPAPRLAALGGRFAVVQVADMVRWKRHDLFIDAMADVCSQDAEARAAIVGRALPPDGEVYLRELQNRVAGLGLHDRIEFVTDCENAVPWIAAADLLVSTADDEPFGRVVVESLAVGTPVVVTEGGGPEEIARQANGAATMVPATPARLADAILARRCPVGRLAVYNDAVRCAQAYDISRVVPRIEAVYRQILDEYSSRPANSEAVAADVASKQEAQK